MKILAVSGAIGVLLAAALVPVALAANPGDCSNYARNRADNEAGGGALGGAARGAAKGALLGVIVGGSKGARRGAAVGGGVGALGGAARRSNDRESLYRYYFDACMRGDSR